MQSGITVLLWAGDADWICNWKGGIAAAEDVKYPGQKEFQSKHLEPYTVDGKQMGTFKGVDNFSFLRVFEAGHEVPYYRMLSALFSSAVVLTRYRAESCATSVQPDHAQEADFLDVIPTREGEYRCRLTSAVGGHGLVMERVVCIISEVG